MGKGFGVFMLILIIVILILFLTGNLNSHTGAAVKKYVDPCETKYKNCVHACGEGLLSGICKEKCTYDRRVCKS
jgi:hypothetical protein